MYIFTLSVCSFTLFRFSLKLPTIKNPFKEERKLEMWTKKILMEQDAVTDLTREKIKEIRWVIEYSKPSIIRPGHSILLGFEEKGSTGRLIETFSKYTDQFV